MQEAIWRQVFNNEIEELDVPHEWRFSVDNSLQIQQAGWLQWKQYTFGGFTCPRCKRLWYSGEVLVLFAMKLDKRLSYGAVKMRIFKQECKRCKPTMMQDPIITQENINVIVTNLVNRIKNKIYEQNDRYPDLRPVEYGKIDGPHEEKHCEACILGICRQQSPPSQEESSSASAALLSTIIVGIGGLALWMAAKK